MIDFASALEEVAANSVLFTPFPRVQIDFAREIFTEWAEETGVELTNIYSLKKLSKTKVRISGKFTFSFNRKN